MNDKNLWIIKMVQLRRAQWGILILLILALPGCVNLISDKKLDFEQITLDVNLESGFSDGLKPVDWQLSVEKPATSGFYNSDRIVALVNGYDYTYVSGIRWIDKLSNLVQSAFIQAFEDSGRIGGVWAPGSGISSTYILLTTIRKFQIEVNVPKLPEVVLVVSAKLFDVKQRKVIDSKVFKQHQMIEKNELKNTTEAFNDTFSRLAEALVMWSLSHS